MNYRLSCVLAGIVLVCAGWALAAGRAYDPQAVPDLFRPETLDLTVNDKERQRDIPLRVYLPSEKTAAPAVLFSHGLGGSREGCRYLGEHGTAGSGRWRSSPSSS
jgi:predicted dienelactone hydrolase